jgi:hypothetical protein
MNFTPIFQPWSVKNHSWYGEIAHITLHGKVVRRVLVKDLILMHENVFQLQLEYGRNGKQIKYATPLALLFCNNLWFSREVMSDDDEENRSLFVPPLTGAPLPKFIIYTEQCPIDMAKLSTHQSTTLRTFIREVNQIHQILRQ